MMDLERLAAALGAVEVVGRAPVEVRDLAYDTRDVVSGSLFFCVGGARRGVRHTTPEAIDLQRLFREMLDAGDRSVALEASSHASALHRLDRVRFAALVFTNLSHEHLDFHSDMEDYFQAKRRLFVEGGRPPAAVNT